MRTSRQSRGSRQKVLVIEDDPVARADLEARLEANGYIVARAALAADEEPRVQAEVRLAALRQLVAGGPLAESVHIVLVTVVAAVVWNSQPVGLTLGWVGAVAAAAGLRSWWRLRATKRVLSAEEALRGVRLTVAGVGLAWGFGAAAAIPALGLDEAALILVVLAGLVAGATGTLVG